VAFPAVGRDPARDRGAEAVRVADNMLLYQRDNGGWPQRYPSIDYRRVFGDREKARIRGEKRLTDTMLDNGATHPQLRYLARVATATGEERFKAGFLRGVDYLLAAQLPCGGWAQSHPRAVYGDYARLITFNDGAMIGALTVLHEVAVKGRDCAFVDAGRRARAAAAVERGVDCILRCQMVVEGKPTVWGQQHDPKTFEPRGARSFEPPALCAGESVGIVRFLMRLDSPGPEVIEAVENAVEWFDKARITGKHRVRKVMPDGKPDCVIVDDPDAPPQWARFYHPGGDLDGWPLGVDKLRVNQAIFVDVDHRSRHFNGKGRVYDELGKISRERRTGYCWLGPFADDLLENDYPAWRRKWLPREAEAGPMRAPRANAR